MESYEIRESIELQLAEHIPLPAPEVVFDYEIAHIEDKAQHFDANVSVMPRTVVMSYLDVLHKAGLVPLAFELEGQSIARSVIKFGDMGTFMVVDFGNERTNISIVSGEMVWFTSSAEIGGSALTEAIIKDYHVNVDEAEKMKLDKGLLRTGYDDVYTSIVSSVSVLSDEIKKNYHYWNTHGISSKHIKGEIEKILLSGGTASLPGLSEYIMTNIPVAVELANPWTNLFSLEEHMPPINFSDSLKYAAAVGLALRSL